MDPREHLDDWLAGELPPAEADAVAKAVAADPTLAGEAERRRARRRALQSGPVPPTPDLATLVTRRASWERVKPRAPRRRWQPLLVAGILGFAIGAGMGWWQQAHPSTDRETVAWTEDGTPVQTTQASLLPVGNGPVVKPVVAGAAQPWFGVWIRPVDLAIPELAVSRGHLILRVDSGSSADAAGIRPGDVLLYLDDCPMRTPDCIRHALDGHTSGDPVTVDWYCASAGARMQKTVNLGTRWD